MYNTHVWQSLKKYIDMLMQISMLNVTKSSTDPFDMYILLADSWVTVLYKDFQIHPDDKP